MARCPAAVDYAALLPHEAMLVQPVHRVAQRLAGGQSVLFPETLKKLKKSPKALLRRAWYSRRRQARDKREEGEHRPSRRDKRCDWSAEGEP